MSAYPTNLQSYPSTIPHALITEMIDWIDRELGDVYKNGRGKGGNTLLSLRKILEDRSLNRIIARLCAILPSLEKNHYLLGYRIRTLLSSQFRFKISDPLERTPARIAPLTFSKNSLQETRRFFFEHAATVIPFGDIRLEVLANDHDSRNQSCL